jgi:hypothetical protein
LRDNADPANYQVAVKATCIPDRVKAKKLAGGGGKFDEISRYLCVLGTDALAATVAGAADYPERNITVVVPFPPGGASDVTARLTIRRFSGCRNVALEKGD